MGMASEKMESEATMHHMLRDNLYANRKQVELQGHLRYRKVNNIDADRISIDMKVNFTRGSKYDEVVLPRTYTVKVLLCTKSYSVVRLRVSTRYKPLT